MSHEACPARRVVIHKKARLQLLHNEQTEQAFVGSLIWLLIILITSVKRNSKPKRVNKGVYIKANSD
uniref:Uncharacterized protein n=1 Tax=Glossina pallidipes TaxID=7398 RepID=A0A1B0AHV2_GLOPL